MAKIGVGIIGYEPGRSWAAAAHVPALRALPDYEVVAVATTRAESAAASAADIGLDHGYDDYRALIADPRVDLVAVTVKVPYHRELVLAAAAAGKHIFCEWPLGNGLDEAVELADAVRRAGVRAVVGLQARVAPAVDHARSLIAENYVGEVLSTTLVGSGMQWGALVDKPNAYIVDRANGATLMTIPMGHTVDALCHVLGEFASLSAATAIRQPEVVRTDTGERLRKTADDQIVIAGTLAGGAVASVHYRGGISRGVKLLWEINGSEGDLQLTAAGGHAQIFELTLHGARGGETALQPLPLPARHRWAPAELAGPSVNVAQLYARFAEDLAGGGKSTPDFDDAVVRHRMLADVERSAGEGRRVAAAG